jgi:hypothetical protein
MSSSNPNEAFRDAVAEVVNYSWPSEERDYWEQLPEDREGHVFESLRVLQAWLDANRQA